MNKQPHSHKLEIEDRDWRWDHVRNKQKRPPRWVITYGDQSREVLKPTLEDPETVLAQAVRELIRRHDVASQVAGNTEGATARVQRLLQPRDLENWGTAQLIDREDLPRISAAMSRNAYRPE